MEKKHRRSSGFTLVETIVSVTVLAIAIGAASFVVQSGLSNATFARDQVTAFYLAQEAVEYVKNVRDTNSRSEALWLEGLSDCESEVGCGIDVTTTEGSIRSCALNSCLLRRNDHGEEARGLYGYDESWNETRFERRVVIECVGGGDLADCDREARIRVVVEWDSRGREHSFSVTQHIFNWGRDDEEE